MSRKENSASKKLEEYIKNFENKYTIKIKQQKGAFNSKNSKIKEPENQTDTTYKIVKLIDHLSQKVENYKNEVSLENIQRFIPVTKCGTEVSICSSNSSTSNKNKCSSSSIAINEYTENDPYLKSLKKLKELNEKLMIDKTK